jgi:hypothetical protein
MSPPTDPQPDAPARAAYPFDSAPEHEVSIGGGGGTLPYLRCSPCQVLIYEPQAGPLVSLAAVVAFLRAHGVFP